ncbi:MAG: L-glyceraldehyde 3-phosphate reductase, partial [Chloroflexota bacterium]
MKRNAIPNTDLKVSPFCLGTMTFGTPVEENEAIRITHHALDLGINFIDTANMYEGYKRYVGS